MSSSLNGTRSNASILNGLGKIKLPARQSMDEVSMAPDVKPVIDKDEDCAFLEYKLMDLTDL